MDHGLTIIMGAIAVACCLGLTAAVLKDLNKHTPTEFYLEDDLTLKSLRAKSVIIEDEAGHPAIAMSVDASGPIITLQDHTGKPAVTIAVEMDKGHITVSTVSGKVTVVPEEA